MTPNKISFKLSSLKSVLVVTALGLTFSLVQSSIVFAQDVLPADNGLATYHTSPRYRESESHPLRVAAYILHPVGWVLREAIFRPLSYFASSTEETRSVMGFREPYDYREPNCFTSDDSVPDCRSLPPFNYDASGHHGTDTSTASIDHSVYLPDVNFDFNKSTLNDLGRGRVHQIANVLKGSGNVDIVLQGNTDFKGNDPYNEKLGQARADTVKSELISLGVPAEKVKSVTFGKTQPALNEQEDWARAVNRRVEVKLEKESAPVPVVKTR